MADPVTPEVVVGTELEISPSVPTYDPNTMLWSSGEIPYTTGTHEVSGNLVVSGETSYISTSDTMYNSLYSSDTTGALTITSGTGMSVSIGDNFSIMQPSGCQMRLESGGAFVFSTSMGEMLRLESDGKFIVKGTTVTTNLDVYRGFREWMGRVGF